MKDLFDYCINYPYLIYDIYDYFTISNGDLNNKSIYGFLESSSTKYGILQPNIISKICEILCDKSKMTRKKTGSPMCMKDSYMSVVYDKEMWKNKKEEVSEHLNCIVYGFGCIYRKYKDRVLPLISFSSNGDQSMGSCFCLFDGIVTAKHCLSDGIGVAIQGYSANELNSSKVLYSRNENIDIAFIKIGDKNYSDIDSPQLLDDVLVMGYPKIPFFIDFCTAEKATISSKAKIRITPTIGSIAAKETMYYPANMPEVLLVTAKMAGGNSGGPIINSEGNVVGVSTGIPSGKGLSDDNVGYGLAYPIQAVQKMILEYNVVNINFVDFP